MTTALFHDHITPLDMRIEGDPFPAPAPPTWTGPHVALRHAQALKMEEAQQVVGDHMNMCMQTCWPRPMYDADDLGAQREQRELEGADEDEIGVTVWFTPRQNSQMNAALGWVMKYLPDDRELRLGVNKVSLARSLGLGADTVAKRCGGCAETWRRRHDLGCELIARGLIRDRVMVF